MSETKIEKSMPTAILGRPIDFSYPTNLAILVMSGLVLLIAFGINYAKGFSFLQSLGQAVVIFLSVFLTWALTREFDPDHPYSAFVSAGFAAVGAFYLADAAFLLVLSVLISARVLNRVVSPREAKMEWLILAGIEFLLISNNYWEANTFFLFILVFDRLIESNQLDHFIQALPNIFVSVSFILVFYAGYSTSQWVPISIILVFFLLFNLLINKSKEIETVDDLGQNQLNPDRIRLLQALVLFLLGLSVLSRGGASFSAFLPVWAMLAGASTYNLVGSFFHKKIVELTE